MIAKITKGSGAGGFRRALTYLLRTKRPGEQHLAAVVGGNMAGRNAHELAAEFGAFLRLRPSLGRAVCHISLSPAPGDRALSSPEWTRIVDEVVGGLGYSESPFVTIRHDSVEPDRHAHVHVLVSRVNSRGNTVSDAHDYRRAETILRRIENDYGLIAVESSLQKHKKRRMAMNDAAKKFIEQRMEAGADGAEAALNEAQAPERLMSIACPEGLSEKHRRVLRRELLDEESYQALLHAVLGDELKHVHPVGRQRVIYLRSGARLHDYGDKITAYKCERNEAQMARFMVEMAVARGWPGVCLSGGPTFVRAAMKEAVSQGFPVSPADEVQKRMLNEILAEERGGAGLTLTPKASPPAIAAESESMEDPREPVGSEGPAGLLARLEARRMARLNPLPPTGGKLGR